MNGKVGQLFNKSRYGRVSTKRKFNEEGQGTSLGQSSQTASKTLPKKNKSKLSSSVSNNIPVNVRNGRLNEFCLGDIVWAKTGKYPVWPGIIINDPESNKFSTKENNILMLHISYCNDGFKRNWIKVNQIFKFFGKKSLLNENPKILTEISRRKLKIKWNRAVDEAEYLVRMNKEERIQAYFDNNFLPNIKVEPMNNSNKVNSRKSEGQLSKNKPVEIVSNVSSSQNATDSVVIHVSTSKLPYENQDNENKNYPKDHPRTLIPELCKLFYSNGWVTGTGGGISIKYNNQIFIAPSGVQKERMEPEDLFVQDMVGGDIELPPVEKNLSKSQCTPIFMCSYTGRNAGAVIHIHSPSVVKLCLLNPQNELRFSGLEMMKGIYNEEKERFYDNDEEIVIPIIENSKYERDLVDTFKQALKKYPSTSAILVRNHGMYVWGKDWKSAKTQCECYEYVFNILVFKKTNNL